jgi:hypothetical protein
MGADRDLNPGNRHPVSKWGSGGSRLRYERGLLCGLARGCREYTSTAVAAAPAEPAQIDRTTTSAAGRPVN